MAHHMHFPVYFKIAGLQLHPHFVLEALAYFLGFQVYLAMRKRSGDLVAPEMRRSVIAAAAAGAAIGSKLLYWLEDPAQTALHWHNPAYMMAGKTIVGGLLGGLLAVELVKRAAGEAQATGDLFAVPLCVGIAVGRIGCFLTGISDNTYGIATSLPWGVDFGDGISRHPTQLYEMIFVLVLAAWLFRYSQKPHWNGVVFKLFMVGYLAFRLVIDFIKPGVSFAGLTFIQWACLAGLCYYGALFSKEHRSKTRSQKMAVAS